MKRKTFRKRVSKKSRKTRNKKMSNPRNVRKTKTKNMRKIKTRINKKHYSRKIRGGVWPFSNRTKSTDRVIDGITYYYLTTDNDIDYYLVMVKKYEDTGNYDDYGIVQLYKFNKSGNQGLINEIKYNMSEDGSAQPTEPEGLKDDSELITNPELVILIGEKIDELEAEKRAAQPAAQPAAQLLLTKIRQKITKRGTEKLKAKDVIRKNELNTFVDGKGNNIINFISLGTYNKRVGFWQAITLPQDKVDLDEGRKSVKFFLNINSIVNSIVNFYLYWASNYEYRETEINRRLLGNYSYTTNTFDDKFLSALKELDIDKSDQLLKTAEQQIIQKLAPAPAPAPDE